VQVAPTNTNVSVRFLSDGDSGDVEQSNQNEAGDAFAGNWNETAQSNDQSQSGTGGDAWTGDATGGSGGGSGDGRCGCGGTHGGGGGDADSGAAYGGDVTQSQTASNANETTQSAEATSEAVQVAPRNTNLGFELPQGRHATSCGCGEWKPKDCGCGEWEPKGCGCDRHHGRGGPKGDLEQRNSNRAGDAVAGNRNGTAQSNAQSQDAAGGNASTGDAAGGNGAARHADHRGWKDGCGCDEHRSKDDRGGGDARSGDAFGGDVDQSQDASNRNGTTQDAVATSTAKQLGFAPKGR
jgi:hypothetical protein